MGCGCNKYKKIESNFEITNENIENVEDFQNDDNKLKSIIKIQRFIRSKQSKNKTLQIKQSISNNNSLINTSRNQKGSKESTSRKLNIEIPQEEFDKLTKEYPPLNDGIIVSKNGPLIDKNTQSVYLGEWDFNKNLKHGRGIQYWSEGSKYYGYWLCGKANIKGKLIHHDGDIYEGGWENDQPNGKGKYIHSDGTIYEGDWKNDKQHGKGKEIWPDGAWYEGDYLNGQKHGNGKFYWSDGSYYEGDFMNNNINGYGKYIFGDKRTYEGTWVNNKLDGKGVFSWPDGRKYEGEYKNDKKEGFGCFYWNNGKIYKGNWKNGKKHGEGEVYFPKEEKWKKGLWKDGERIKYFE